MSRTFSIGCQQCRKHLWIAQASASRQTLYYGKPRTMEALKVFLFEHRGHDLLFDDNVNTTMEEWEEIETEPAEPPLHAPSNDDAQGQHGP